MVCIFFAVQGIRLWLDKPPTTVWVMCHWIGEGSLCVIAGLCGLFLEVRICFPDISKNRKLFALNRLGLAFGYIWVGCYTMGGHVQEGAEAWRLLGRVTGILAWVVCAGDVCIACCSDSEQASPRQTSFKDAEMNMFSYDKSEDIDHCKNCGNGRSPKYKYCPIC